MTWVNKVKTDAGDTQVLVANGGALTGSASLTHDGDTLYSETASLNTAAIHGYSTNGGEGVRGESTTGSGVEGLATTGTGLRGTNASTTNPTIHTNNTDATNAGPLAWHHNADGEGVEVSNDGGLNWTTASGAQTSRTNMLPDQTGNSGKVLMSDGSDVSWEFAGSSAVERTGSTIAFDLPAVYNTPIAPVDSAVTLDLTGAVPGTEVVAYFDHAAEPSWPSGVTPVGTWNNGSLNIVRFLYQDTGEISAAITSSVADAPTNIWRMVFKATTESRTTNTVLTADSVLVVPMAASQVTVIRGELWGGAAGSGPNFKYGFTGPASPTVVRASAIHTASVGTPPADYAVGAYDTTGKTFTMGGGGLTVVKVDFYIVNGANSGDFQITWAQGTSSGTATNMGQGSWLEYMIIT